MNLKEFWAVCLLKLQQNISVQQYQKWLAPLTFTDNGTEWVIFARTTFVFNHISSQFWNEIVQMQQELVITEPVPKLMLKIGKGEEHPSSVLISSMPPEVNPPVHSNQAGPSENGKRHKDGLHDQNYLSDQSEPVASESPSGVQKKPLRPDQLWKSLSSNWR